MKDDSLYEKLLQRGVTRRDFMKFCAAMAAALALPSTEVAAIAKALGKGRKPFVVWLECQDCAGNTESLLRASKPTAAEILLDLISLEYHETLMASAGKQAVLCRDNVVKKQKGKYIAIVEGAIPMKDDGVYCCIGGRTAKDIAQEVCGNAAVTIAIGSCASWGGLPAAAPNPTGAVSVQKAIPGIPVVNLPGCPVNTENLTATLVHYLTYGAMPELDNSGRPLFAYGKNIHDLCERRVHFDEGRFVRAWGDDAHRNGWCLYHMGCKGPASYSNCPTIKFNMNTSWPVQAGHGCIACTTEGHWDAMSPFYTRLPNVPGAGMGLTGKKVGTGLAAITAAGLAANGIRRAIKAKNEKNNIG